MEDKHSCPTCRRDFETSRGMRVHHSRAHEEVLENRSCAHCEKQFYSQHEQKYCCEECRDAAVSFEGACNPNHKDAQRETECEICGEPFEYYPSEKVGRFCSKCTAENAWQTTPSLTGKNNPRWNGGKQRVECTVCGVSVDRWPSARSAVTVCSESCRREWLSKSFTGSGHPNWRGGTNTSYGPQWSRARRLALDRDGHRCRVCDTPKSDLGRNPDVHHIVPVRFFEESEEHDIEDAHTLSNVISLCISCHRKAEFGKISDDLLYGLLDE